MHELAIAESIVRIASAHAGERPVAKVVVRIGHLRQVVPSSLEFGFGLVAEGTPVAGAELAIEEVPAVGCCSACGAEGRLEAFPLQCQACGGLDLEVTEGEELLVDSLELDDRSQTPAPLDDAANRRRAASSGSSMQDQHGLRPASLPDSIFASPGARGSGIDHLGEQALTTTSGGRGT